MNILLYDNNSNNGHSASDKLSVDVYVPLSVVETYLEISSNDKNVFFDTVLTLKSNDKNISNQEIADIMCVEVDLIKAIVDDIKNTDGTVIEIDDVIGENYYVLLSCFTGEVYLRTSSEFRLNDTSVHDRACVLHNNNKNSLLNHDDPTQFQNVINNKIMQESLADSSMGKFSSPLVIGGEQNVYVKCKMYHNEKGVNAYSSKGDWLISSPFDSSLHDEALKRYILNNYKNNKDILFKIHMLDKKLDDYMLNNHFTVPTTNGSDFDIDYDNTIKNCLRDRNLEWDKDIAGDSNALIYVQYSLMEKIISQRVLSINKKERQEIGQIVANNGKSYQSIIDMFDGLGVNISSELFDRMNSIKVEHFIQCIETYGFNDNLVSGLFALMNAELRKPKSTLLYELHRHDAEIYSTLFNSMQFIAKRNEAKHSISDTEPNERKEMREIFAKFDVAFFGKAMFNSTSNKSVHNYDNELAHMKNTYFKNVVMYGIDELLRSIIAAYYGKSGTSIYSTIENLINEVYKKCGVSNTYEGDYKEKFLSKCKEIGVNLPADYSLLKSNNVSEKLLASHFLTAVGECKINDKMHMSIYRHHDLFLSIAGLYDRIGHHGTDFNEKWINENIHVILLHLKELLDTEDEK